MPWLLAFYLCLLQLISFSEVAVEAFDINSIKTDLQNINLTCAEDSCDNEAIDSLSSRTCHCGKQCVQLGTCCIDSYYTSVPQPKLKPSCRKVYGGFTSIKNTYYLIDKCPSTDSVWSSLCHAEWNGDDDVQKLVPVTSLLTFISYKNYYCFKCHEANDEFLYWTVNIMSNYDPNKISEFDARRSSKRISLTYDKDRDTWMAIYDEKIGYFPVSISLQIPSEISLMVHVCEPDLISNCSEKWSDEEVRDKCQSYMALKEVYRNGSSSLKYKNIHCALCNFESLNDISCRSKTHFIFTSTKVFSFSYLLDINPSDGELVGKIQKCPSDQIWDPFTEKCRKLSCALPGYKVKNGKCVQE